ncbi:MAG: glycine cleavage system aminomethyltransferase GcvT [Planctomycetes bacterium]|nr:glycine cleavage system aminomethyltransferase GcvT [Planctomycetota bacterium]
MSDPSSQPAARTALHRLHRQAGATLIDFHGWEMPLRYGAIPEEHRRVRESAGLFDLCHMGRLELIGDGAETWLQHVLSGDVGAMESGRARYTLILNDRGTVIDDAIVYRLPESWLLVVNASNRLRVIDWLGLHRPAGVSAQLIDRTPEWAMIALQGPRSAEIIPSLVEHPDRPWNTLGYYQILSASFEGQKALVARTGYTGENGFEVYLAADQAERFWLRALEAGGDAVSPVGLGARDTLRLEAGMPLYGNEIDESTNPFEAGLDFAVKLEKKADFVGKRRLVEIRASGVHRSLRGFRVEGRRVARQGMKIHRGDAEVGVITSGAPSPTLGYPIAMGYLDRSAQAGGGLEVDVRGRREKLAIVDLPFYSRTRKRG